MQGENKPQLKPLFGPQEEEEMGDKVGSTWVHGFPATPGPTAPGAGPQAEVRREGGQMAKTIHVETLETRGILLPQLVECGALRNG